jgi:glycosyltransferase involved in cell wall biosynthesis
MRVSVIIPTYNYGPYIEEAVASVLGQGIDDLEVIVVDDASTDDTLARLARCTDARLRVAALARGGVCLARNHGLSLARGTYIAFLDADDRWRPGKLARQLAILEREPDVGMVFTNFRRFDANGAHAETQFDHIPGLTDIPTRASVAGDGRVIEADTFTSLIQLRIFPAWLQTVVIRADAVADITFPPELTLSQDLYYMARVYTRVRAAYISDVLVDVRRHETNSYQTGADKLAPDIRALTRALVDVTAPPAHRLALRARLGQAWLSLGYQQFSSGHAFRAAPAYLTAMQFPGTRLNALRHLAATPIAHFLQRPSASR